MLVGTFEPGDQRQRGDKHHPADPADGHRGWHERHADDPLQREPGKHGERPSDRRPDDDIGGIGRVIHDVDGRTCAPYFSVS
jgi:hypothetical protein